MKRLVLLLVSVLAGAVWWLSAGGDSSLQPAGLATADATGSAPAPVEADAAVGPDAGPTDASARIPTAVDAAAGSDEAPPIPADAEWLDVLVVDRATQEPVVDAEVAWITSDRFEELARDWSFAQRMRNQMDLVAKKSGWRARSDARGMVRVHLGGWTNVFAWRPGQYGTIGLGSNYVPPIDGCRLELAPDNSLLVRVVDPDGAPAPGAEVVVWFVPAGAARPPDRRTNRPALEPTAIARAPDGLAEVTHLRQRYQIDPRRPGEYRVGVRVLGSNSEGVVFDSLQPPTEPIELRLPKTGSLKARLDGAARTAGNPSGASLVRLNSEGKAEDRSSWQPADPDGWVRFPHLTVGGEYRIDMWSSGAAQNRRFAGPRPGEELELVLTAERNGIYVCGRVLTPERTPLVDRELHLRIATNDDSNEYEVRTDADGRFSVHIGPFDSDADPPPSLRELFVVVDRKGEPAQAAKATGRPLGRGDNDVGDLVLGQPPVIVAGRFDCGARALPHLVDFNIERRQVDDEGAESWEWVWPPHTERERDGRFAVLGETEPGRYRLRVNAYSTLPMAPIEFAVGQRDLVVTLDPGHPLTASALLPPWTRGVVAQLRPATPIVLDGGRIDDSGEERFQRELQTSDHPRCRIEWRSLPPGRYTLAMLLAIGGEPLLTIPDVMVPPPPDGDPRLRDIDLSAAIAWTTIDVTDQDGKQLTNERPVVVALPLADARDRSQRVQNGRAAFATRPGPIDVIVGARGFTPQLLRGVRGSATVRLQPLPTLEIAVQHDPLPANVGLFAALRLKQQGEPAVAGIPWPKDLRIMALMPQSQSRRVVEQGRVTFAVSESLYTLQLSLRQQEGESDRSVQIALPTPVELRYTGLPANIAIPTAALQKALEQLQPKANDKEAPK